MATIIPTVGRVVWFFENDQQAEPKAAIVAKVWNSAMVNLMVVEESGTTRPVTSVTLLEENEQPQAGNFFAKWMPYQIGQAKKDSAA